MCFSMLLLYHCSVYSLNQSDTNNSRQFILLSKIEAEHSVRQHGCAGGTSGKEQRRHWAGLQRSGNEVVLSQQRPILYFGGRDVNNGRLYEKQLQLGMAQQASYVQMTGRLPSAILCFSASHAAQSHRRLYCCSECCEEQCVHSLLATGEKVKVRWGGVTDIHWLLFKSY